MAAPRIAIFAEGPDWHARRLKDAFQRQGAEATCLALASCGVRTTGTGLHLPKYDKGLPDAAFVKTVAAGSFEQVTMRLGVLHALRDMGTMVVNDARAIERCVDKSMTSFLLHRHGIPTPETWAVESPDEARTIVRSEARPGRPLVLKPLFGSQGRGLKLVEKLRDLPAAEEAQGVFYLQRYVTGPTAGWRDWRVFVVGGRAIAAMIRHGVQWRTNAAQGARCQGVPAAGEIADLAVAAARAVDADYAGVDIIQDRAGHHLVLEINSMPAWRALHTATGIDIAR
ncbi:MAG TPA: RimK family alpha-L-glutamate ligase, partial [Dongiaceae bacterium]